MIATRLTGGLGNQMFEYAAARALSLKLNTELYMDLSWFSNIAEADTSRFYELDQFTLKQSFLEPKTYLLFEPDSSSIAIVLRRLKHPALPTLKLYKEPHFQYDPDFLELTKGVYLDGYWQSYRYFDTYRDTLLADFSIVESPSKKSQMLLKKISSQDSVSLHIRRGDYVSNKAAAEFHGTIDLSYYYRATESIASRVSDPHIYVFSDDPKWCKQNLNLNYPTTFVSHNSKGVEDMRLMSACRHNILANSSFSWWGAWLNQNPNKIVVRPKHWFNDPKIDTSDLVPQEWKAQ